MEEADISVHLEPKTLLPLESHTITNFEKTLKYYNNEKGSLYKVANERGWNPYLFDIVKRLERGGKKDPLKQEIEKTKLVLDLWLREQ